MSAITGCTSRLDLGMRTSQILNKPTFSISNTNNGEQIATLSSMLNHTETSTLGVSMPTTSLRSPKIG